MRHYLINIPYMDHYYDNGKDQAPVLSRQAASAGSPRPTARDAGTRPQGLGPASEHVNRWWWMNTFWSNIAKSKRIYTSPIDYSSVIAKEA